MMAVSDHTPSLLGLDHTRRWSQVHRVVQRRQVDVLRDGGALTGAGASGGIFITTSTFSSDARKYVERLTPRVILVDGSELGRLMVDYGVGVTAKQTLRVMEVDENFFDAE